MPQLVTVSISLDTHYPTTVDNRNECSLESSENNIASGGKKTPTSVKPTGLTSLHNGSQGNDNKNAMANTAPPPLTSRPTAKRTKKIAKPKNKAKKGPSTRARKLPKNNDTKNNGPTKPTPINKKKGGKSTSKSPIAKNNQTETSSNSKAKSKRHKSTEAGPTKKPTRKRKPPDLPGGGLLPTKYQKSKDESQTSLACTKLELEPEPEVDQEMVTPISFRNEDPKIEEVVSTVVDTITDEIRHSAPMFGTNHPKVVMRCNSADSSDKKILRDPHSDDIEGFNPSEKNGGESSCLKNQGAGKKQGTFSNTHSVHMSKGGTLHPVNTDDHAIKPSNDDTSPKKKGCTSRKVPLRETSSVSEMYNVRMVVLAVRRFVLEVYFPFLCSAKTSLENSSPNCDRIQISAFLAIREMLIMNAHKLFTFPTMKGPSTNGAKRERFFASRVLANAIVRNAAKRMYVHHPGSHFFADFVQAAQNYDAKSDDFQFSLARGGAESKYVHSDGKKVGHQESLLAKVSFNYTRAKHPLLHSKQASLKYEREGGLVRHDRSSTQHLPAPSACAVFHIEADASSSSDEAEDSAELMKSWKHVIKSKLST